MGYATQQDLIDRYGAEELTQLTDRQAIPPATIDAAVAQRALDDATAMIDSYLLRRYDLPLAATPPALVKIACDVARFFLWGDRADPKGGVAAAYDDARKWLKLVADDDVKLDIGGASPPAQTTSGARLSAGEPMFTRSSLRGAS